LSNAVVKILAVLGSGSRCSGRERLARDEHLDPGAALMVSRQRLWAFATSAPK